MHCIVAHAHTAFDPRRAKLDTPALDALLRDAAVESRDDGHIGDDDSAYTAPHERAWARAHGLEPADGLVPYARALAAGDGVVIDDAPWALLSPVHARVALDHVTITAPSHAVLGDAESRALFGTLEPLFTDIGWRLAYGHAHRWYASHPTLAMLATASIERTRGEGIEPWLPRGESARTWQRLQNECQMLLYTDPVNEARESRREAPINSLWLSGTGAPMQPRREVFVDERLRDASGAGGTGGVSDEATWRAAWSAIDRERIAPMLEASASPDDRLTLCGGHRSITFVPRARRWWQRLSRPATAVGTVLQAL